MRYNIGLLVYINYQELHCIPVAERSSITTQYISNAYLQQKYFEALKACKEQPPVGHKWQLMCGEEIEQRYTLDGMYFVFQLQAVPDKNARRKRRREFKKRWAVL